MSRAAKVNFANIAIDVIVVEDFIPDGYVACNPWVGVGMHINALEPTPQEPTRKEQEVARKLAYVAEADPIFFMSQRGEATVGEWEAKVAEIKARYPYPAEPYIEPVQE
jgi:hypothetical protein